MTVVDGAAWNGVMGMLDALSEKADIVATVPGASPWKITFRNGRVLEVGFANVDGRDHVELKCVHNEHCTVGMRLPFDVTDPDSLLRSGLNCVGLTTLGNTQ